MTINEEPKLIRVRFSGELEAVKKEVDDYVNSTNSTVVERSAPYKNRGTGDIYRVYVSLIRSEPDQDDADEEEYSTVIEEMKDEWARYCDDHVGCNKK